MPGLSGEELRFALWFLLAGFVAGFAVSTVWEWLYFRRERWSLDQTDPFTLQTGGSTSVPAPVRAATLDTENRIEPPLVETDSTGAPGFEVFQAPARSALDARVPALSPFAAPVPLVVEGRNGNRSSPGEPAQVPAAPRRGARQAAAKRSRGLPDDLTQIKGITPQFQQRLYAANIFTWHQVATSDADVLVQITRAGAAAEVEQWCSRAQALAVEHRRQNASYSGPVPEELTQIQGLTDAHARSLQRVGIVTFAQLAMASAAELATLFEGQQQDDGADYTAWLRTATFLARTGSRDHAPTSLDAEELD